MEPKPLSCEHESFASFCSLLERLRRTKAKLKVQVLKKYMSQFHENADVYPVVRLLLPECDDQRLNYGLREVNLAKILAYVLGLPEAEKNRLAGWKDSRMQQGHNCTAGDFPSVFYSIIESRCAGVSAILTIGEVNMHLGAIHQEADKKGALLKVLSRATPLESKWVVHLILRKMGLGIADQAVMGLYFPDLYRRFYIVEGRLEEALAQARALKLEGITEVTPDPARLFLKPFRPMLADRLNPSQLHKLNAEDERLYVQTKYDGERVLMHLDKTTQSLRVFTRNGIDYTQNYGQVKALSHSIFQSFLAQKAILDGEMMAWDQASASFLEFGHNRSVAKAEKVHIQGQNLCFVCFDLLYIQMNDGSQFSLLDTPLHRRIKDFLKKFFIFREELSSVFRLAETHEVTGGAAVTDLFKQALEAHQEGLVVKLSSSLYRLNERKAGWYKIKPDFDSMFSDTLDLVIMGCYFSRSHRDFGNARDQSEAIHSCTIFLMGALNAKGELVPCARVKTGLTYLELQEVRLQLGGSIQPYSAALHGPQFVGLKEPPDLVVPNFQQSLVMEVRAAEILDNMEYPAGIALRFPRFVRDAIRRTKSVEDATSLAEILEMAREAPRKRARLEGNPGRAEPPTSGLSGLSGVSSMGCPKRQARARVCQPLLGQETCLINGRPGDDQEIRELGGELVKNFRKATTQMVLAHKKDFTTANLVKAHKDVTIYSLSYLEKLTACSLDEGLQLPELADLELSDFIAMSDQMAYKMGQLKDQYGLSLIRDISPEELKAGLERVSVDPELLISPAAQETVTKLLGLLNV